MRGIAIANVLLATIVLLVGVAIPFVGTETESGRDKCYLGAPEGSQTDAVGWSWWPYGTECRLVTRDGSTLREVVPPWRAGVQWQLP